MVESPPPLQALCQLAGMQRYIVQRCLSGTLEPGCYHTQFSYHLRIPGLALPLFFKAVGHVVERHPVMRTAFIETAPDEFRQGINPALELRIRFHDIGALAPREQAQWLEQLLSTDRAQPFVLVDGGEPLARIHLVKRGADTLQFILVLHHAIWDGWSLAVLMKEVLEHYQQLRRNPTGKLLPAAWDYRDFVDDEASSRQSAEAARFWAGHLQHHCACEPGVPVGARQAAAYRPLQASLPADLVNRLEQRAREHKVALKTLFVAATIALAHDAFPRPHTTIGLVSNGRSIRLRHPLTTLGLLWNMAPLCVDTRPPALPRDGLLDAAFLRRVHQALADTSDFTFYPLPDILADRECRELFDVSFNYIDFGGANIVPRESGITFLETGGFDKFHYPINVLVGRNPFDRAVSLVVNYDARLFGAADIELLLERCIARLHRIAQLPA
jgi:hypothetical protein